MNAGREKLDSLFMRGAIARERSRGIFTEVVVGFAFDDLSQ